MMPFMFVSGAFAPLETMPGWMQTIASAQPGRPRHRRPARRPSSARPTPARNGRGARRGSRAVGPRHGWPRRRSRDGGDGVPLRRLRTRPRQRFELRRVGQRQPVEPQVFDVLVLLVRKRHRVVSKQELLDEVWGHRFVGDSALTSRIKSLRQPSATTAQPKASCARCGAAVTSSRPTSSSRRRPIDRGTPTAGALPEAESSLGSSFGRIRLAGASVGAARASVTARRCELQPRGEPPQRWNQPVVERRPQVLGQWLDHRGRLLALVRHADLQGAIQDVIADYGGITHDDAAGLPAISLAGEAHLVHRGEFDKVRAASPRSTWAAGATASRWRRR